MSIFSEAVSDRIFKEVGDALAAEPHTTDNDSGTPECPTYMQDLGVETAQLVDSLAAELSVSQDEVLYEYRRRFHNVAR